MPQCRKCKNELSGKQESYCSLRCSKLHLKSLYRKRNRAKVSAYNRVFRSRGMRPLNARRKNQIKERHGRLCLRCLASKDLNVHHIKPLSKGGTHSTTIVLCFPCHMLLEKMTKGYWI